MYKTCSFAEMVMFERCLKIDVKCLISKSLIFNMEPPPPHATNQSYFGKCEKVENNVPDYLVI